MREYIPTYHHFRSSGIRHQHGHRVAVKDLPQAVFAEVALTSEIHDGDRELICSTARTVIARCFSKSGRLVMPDENYFFFEDECCRLADAEPCPTSFTVGKRIANAMSYISCFGPITALVMFQSPLWIIAMTIPLLMLTLVVSKVTDMLAWKYLHRRELIRTTSVAAVRMLHHVGYDGLDIASSTTIPSDTLAVVVGKTAPAIADTPCVQPRIKAVREALAHLDGEWLAYTCDLEAYFLTKPMLRDATVRATKAYQDALYALREQVMSMPRSPSEDILRSAETAADTALTAWHDANDHAARIGVSDLSPLERTTLRRLHKLMSQLCDTSTPREMWGTLTEAILRETDKLTTVKVSLRDLRHVPSLENRMMAQIGGLSNNPSTC